MNQSVETEGETTQQAVETALQELGVGPEEVRVEVLEEPGKGLLGLIKGKAKVRVTVLDRQTVVEQVVEGLMRELGAEATVETHVEDDYLWVNISGESLGWLIGHHGRTLDAIQVLVGAIASKSTKKSVKVVVDVEGYRARRKKEVQALAERTIGKVLASQEPVSLRPMSAMDRKMVHTIVGQYEGVASISAGMEPERFVIISPK